MTMNKLSDEINEVKSRLLSMCRSTEKMIADAILALNTNDCTLAKQVHDSDSIIDDAEMDIEKRCMRIMWKLQPFAGDFREVSTALKVITDIERIGDQASDIAALVPALGALNEPPVLLAMGELAVKMVRDSVNSFVRHDTALAKRTVAMDDELDELFSQAKREMVTMIKKDVNTADAAVMFLMIAKYLERIGDHAVNVCEWTEFKDKGERTKKYE